MAFFDWNNDGKKDIFDSMMDYQSYNAMFGDEDEDNETDSLFDDGVFDDGFNNVNGGLFDDGNDGLFDDGFNNGSGGLFDDEDDGLFDDGFNNGNGGLFDDGNDELFGNDFDNEIGLKFDDDGYEDFFDGNENEYDKAEDVNSTDDDFFVFQEIAEKSNVEILSILFKRKRLIDNWFEICSVESGFREIYNNRDTVKDLWLYDFARIADFSSLNRDEKIKLVQTLLEIFKVDNKTDAEAHYYNMFNNAAYKAYMEHCFGIYVENGAVFWILLGAMSGNDGERTHMTMGSIKEHNKFIVQLDEYLKRVFPDSGFGRYTAKYVGSLTEYIYNNCDNISSAKQEYIVNPLYFD